MSYPNSPNEKTRHLAGSYIGPQAVVENVFMRISEFSNDWAVVVPQVLTAKNSSRLASVHFGS